MRSFQHNYCHTNSQQCNSAHLINITCKAGIVDKLAETAAWLFSYRQVSEKDLNDFLKIVVLSEDWEEELATKISCCYLKKVSSAASVLAKKLAN
jgi:hypothetical protein